MKNGVDIRELKEIEKKILKGINTSDKLTNPKTVGGFDIAYIKNKYLCCAIVVNFETKEIIEKKIVSGEEIMSYSPNLASFREGPAIIDAYRSLEKKPDVLIVKGCGALNKYKVGLASYVGVLLNKPCIGVSKDLMFGRLDEDKIIGDNEIRGIAIKTKEFANPIFISPGHKINLEKSVEIVKELCIEPYKLPLPLHLAHKYVNKEKKQ